MPTVSGVVPIVADRLCHFIFAKLKLWASVHFANRKIRLLLTYDKFDGSTTVGYFAYAGREGGNFDGSTMIQ